MSEFIQEGVISAKQLSDWIQCWWEWFYSIEEKEHPVYASEYKVRSNDYNQSRVPPNWDDNTKKKVWFLAGAYGTQSTTRSVIPEGEWSILAPAYNMGASEQEFPSLSREKIQSLVEEDVNGATELDANLDGKNLTNKLKRVKWKESGGWFKVRGIAAENILALDDTDSIDMISDGQWLWLKPLPPGDHQLHLSGKSKNYKSDITFNLTVRGPPRPGKEEPTDT